MFIPSPSLMPLTVFDDLDGFLKEIENLKSVSGGVGVYGAAAAYALVWELGSLRLKSPGPKTLWSMNRNDEIAILTRQAPRGYVGIISDQFWPIIEKHMSEVHFGSSNLQLEMEVAMDNASQEIAGLIREIAPVDSGDLRSGIQGISTDEVSVLKKASKLEASGTLIL